MSDPKSEDTNATWPCSEINPQDADVSQRGREYVTGRRLVIIVFSFALSMFLVQLDQTIVSTALPKIVSHFDALPQITWVVSAYLLTQVGCLLSFGQILVVTPSKWVYLYAIAMFELGSLICAVAPSMNTLIVGRAVAGIGAAGITISVTTIVAQIVRLEDRASLMGIIGAMYALSAVSGPLLGGLFTDKLSWRWCFYVNLPIGAASALCSFLLLKPQPPDVDSDLFPGTGVRRLARLDWPGSIICLGMTVTLLLALQEGGNVEPWSDPRVYALFPVCAVLLAVFIGWERRQGARANVPLHLLTNRTLVGSMLSAFFLLFSMLIAIYYLPLFYQAARGASATRSGLDILPLMLSMVFSAMISGGVVTFWGRYWHIMAVSPVFFAVGGALLYTIEADTSTSRLIGFQILYGVGLGSSLQNPYLAVQAEYAASERLIPQVVSLVTFSIFLGSVTGIGGIPQATTSAILQSVTVINALPPGIKNIVIEAYVKSMRPVFIMAVPAGALGLLSAFLIRNHNLKTRMGESLAVRT